MAVSTLESIFDKAILSDAERVRVLSNVGRVYLQLGDVTAASAAFARAKDKTEKVVSDKQVRSLETIFVGRIHIFIFVLPGFLHLLRQAFWTLFGTP